MSATEVIVEKMNGDLTVLTLDRAPVNALSLEVLEQITDHLRRLAAAPPRALVIAGVPGRFSAGFDLKEGTSYGADQLRRVVRALNDLVMLGYGLACPVVTAITGHAIAGGFVLALLGDVRVAAADGRYGLTEVAVGVPFPEATIRLVRAELSPGAARTTTLLGQLHPADHFVHLGVFDEAVVREDVLPRALEHAATLSGHSPDVYQQAKAGLRAETLAAMRAASAADPLLSRPS